MKLRSFTSKTVFVIFTIITVLLCPLTSPRFVLPKYAAAESERQIEFTPQITPLALTQTAESLKFGPVLAATAGPTPTLGPGQYFEKEDPNRPELDPGNIHGDTKFGYAQLTENPSLYEVWITDAEGTHYLIVPYDSEVLTGGTDPEGGFFYLISRQETLLSQIRVAVNSWNDYHEAASISRGGTWVVLVAWAACTYFTGGLCLALGGLGGGLFGLSLSKDTDAKVLMNLIEGDQREFADVQRNMRGKFSIGQVLYDQP